MNELLVYMATFGLDPGVFALDGKIHRFRVSSDDSKKSGWIIGFQNHTRSGGETFVTAQFGNYREGLRETFNSKVKYSKDDRAHIKKQMAEASRKEAAAKEQSHEETAQEVAKKWEALSESGTSDYLVKKKIDVPGLGIKFDKGTFYVPMRDIEGKLWSLQRIFDAGERYEKRFHAGGRVQGCFHVIGSFGEKPERIYIAEGFATAASIRLATGGIVVAAFSANNLGLVGKQLRKRFPEASMFICGDDDCFKDPEKNPGREAAEATAKECLARSAFPIFRNRETKPTDFNDLHCLEGLAEVKTQLEKIQLAPKMAIYALGFDGPVCYFTSTLNRQISAFSKITEKDLLMLAPVEYWEAMYPAEQSRVDWLQAKSSLIDQARRKGIFKLRQVRGSGVWNDEGRIVLNMGDHLLVDGVRCGLGEIKSRYFYTLGTNLNSIHGSPLSLEECGELIRTCESFKWTKQDNGILLAGALVAARVCGALPVRPHTWITGSAQTGKTTLLERLVSPILGPDKLYVFGSTTEAGIRQDLKADAIPVLFDEFETTGHNSIEKIAAVIDLARAAWADSGATIVKGGASGNASHFTVRFAGIFSSIRTKLIKDADKGRFLELELAPHGSDQDHWKELNARLIKIDDEFSERLFARTIMMLPVMKHNFKKLKSALARTTSSRFGDQYGMVLAAFSILLQDDPMEDDDADYLVSQIKLEEERQTVKAADHDDALMHLLTTKVRVDNLDYSIREMIGTVYGSGKSKDVSNWLNQGDDAQTAVLKKELSRYGIRVESEFVAIAASNHATLEKVWERTDWAKTWGNSLARLQGASKKVFRIGGVSCRSIIIPIATIDPELTS